MSLFKVNKPRQYKHTYIYYDERKEKLAKIEENAKRELGMIPPKPFSPEDIRGTFVGATKHLKRRKESRRKRLSNGMLLMIIVILILIAKFLYSSNFTFNFGL